MPLECVLAPAQSTEISDLSPYLRSILDSATDLETSSAMPEKYKSIYDPKSALSGFSSNAFPPPPNIGITSQKMNLLIVL